MSDPSVPVEGQRMNLRQRALLAVANEDARRQVEEQDRAQKDLEAENRMTTFASKEVQGVLGSSAPPELVKVHASTDARGQREMTWVSLVEGVPILVQRSWMGGVTLSLIYDDYSSVGFRTLVELGQLFEDEGRVLGGVSRAEDLVAPMFNRVTPS